ncbi:hypothetical protein PPUN15366_00900 [Pseudomonas putida]|uniref:hypothetical protein n=1 Tax=Pseudomonas putida TaxID=303 RepID=UPI00235CF101|nr:hypothetical protein [Pseudomonas putida]GLO38446.1 hypothetical protein PPUN15366_00900 [Pseudomonas putida]HDS0973484.1 hypothetical protein [Pseudomonas putida]
MLRNSDFDEFSSLRRVFVKNKFDKHKLNNFLTRVNLKIMADDDCLLFLDDSFLGLWGEGVLFTKNYLVYNLLGESGYIPFFRISSIEFVESDVIINSSISLTFRKISIQLVYDIFRVVYSCLKRNDASLIDVIDHARGGAILVNYSSNDSVVAFASFIQMNANKETIVELMGEDNFKDKESIRKYIASDENLKNLAEQLVDIPELEKSVAKETASSFYSAFKYYSLFLYDQINYYKDDLARSEARELELQRKKELAVKKAEVRNIEKAPSICLFSNVFSIKGEPTSDFIDAFLSVVNGYSRKFKMSEPEYWFVFSAHLDFYFYTLATEEILQKPGMNQVFIAPFIFLLEGNKGTVKELSGLMNDEAIKESMVYISLLMMNQRSGKKEDNFNLLYEKILLCNKEISEGEFMQSLSAIRENTKKLIVEVFRPDVERSSEINKLF